MVLLWCCVLIPRFSCIGKECRPGQSMISPLCWCLSGTLVCKKVPECFSKQAVNKRQQDHRGIRRLIVVHVAREASLGTPGSLLTGFNLVFVYGHVLLRVFKQGIKPDVNPLGPADLWWPSKLKWNLLPSHTLLTIFALVWGDLRLFHWFACVAAVRQMSWTRMYSCVFCATAEWLEE